METIGIYIHIPFCVKKCPYCDFISFPYSKDEEIRYIKALCKEIEMKSSPEDVDTIYLGGGTPSLISLESLERIFRTIKENFQIKSSVEVTIEANPGTVTKDKLRSWKDLGINRLSIGAQSFDPYELKILGRIHSPEDIEETLSLAREESFDNINIDLMYSLPFQKKESFLRSLCKALSFKPEHISIYNLTIEPETPFYKNFLDGEIILPENDEEAEMFLDAMSLLEKERYIHYEISNFAKGKNFMCKHNLKYWKQEKYLGFGVSAYSFVPPIRYGNSKNLFVYYEKIKRGSLPLEEMEDLNGEDLAKDFLFLRFRLMEGISEKEFYNKFGKRIKNMLPNFDIFLERGLIENKEDKICLTKLGVLLANEVLQDLF